jgi:hypothetical protein
MCASVCPSQALFFGTREEVERLRPRSTPINQWQFGEQTINTKVRLMAPRTGRAPRMDVTACMNEPTEEKLFSLDLMELGLFEPDEVV